VSAWLQYLCVAHVSTPPPLQQSSKTNLFPFPTVGVDIPMSLVNLKLNILSENSLRATIEFTDNSHPTPSMPPVQTVEAASAPTRADLSSRARRLLGTAHAWVSAHLLDDERASQLADEVEMAYMSLEARKALLADRFAESKASLVDTLAVAPAAVLAKTAALAETVGERGHTLTRELSAHKEALTQGLATRKAVFAEAASVRKASLAEGVAQRKAALADVTNSLASRTQAVVHGLETRLQQKEASMAGSDVARRASKMLGDAVETGSVVAARVSDTVADTPAFSRAVSSAGAVANRLSGWASAALEEGREFISIQQF
jgi:hypothetical protein